MSPGCLGWASRLSLVPVSLDRALELSRFCSSLALFDFVDSLILYNSCRRRSASTLNPAEVRFVAAKGPVSRLAGL